MNDLIKRAYSILTLIKLVNLQPEIETYHMRSDSKVHGGPNYSEAILH